MGTLSATTHVPIPSDLRLKRSLPSNQIKILFCRRRPRKIHSIAPVARLFGPAIFESSKLEVLFLGVDEKKHPGKLPRTYTFTHSDINSKLTLAISETINNSQLQGWYSKLQRDEVVAEWKKVKGEMSLHVHCHISGGLFLLDLFAKLRFFIFCKELPVVFAAFVHGDENLLNNYPELQEALVWVYFHSNIPEYNRVECWGPLKEAVRPTEVVDVDQERVLPEPCPEDCICCFPPVGTVPWSQAQVPPNFLHKKACFSQLKVLFFFFILHSLLPCYSEFVAKLGGMCGRQS